MGRREEDEERSDKQSTRTERGRERQNGTARGSVEPRQGVGGSDSSPADTLLLPIVTLRQPVSPISTSDVSSTACA